MKENDEIFWLNGYGEKEIEGEKVIKHQSRFLTLVTKWMVMPFMTEWIRDMVGETDWWGQKRY